MKKYRVDIDYVKRRLPEIMMCIRQDTDKVVLIKDNIAKNDAVLIRKILWNEIEETLLLEENIIIKNGQY